MIFKMKMTHLFEVTYSPHHGKRSLKPLAVVITKYPDFIYMEVDFHVNQLLATCGIERSSADSLFRKGNVNYTFFTLNSTCFYQTIYK